MAALKSRHSNQIRGLWWAWRTEIQLTVNHLVAGTKSILIQATKPDAQIHLANTNSSDFCR